MSSADTPAAEPTFCGHHHQTPATAACQACGEPICDVCTTSFNTRPYCPGCHVGRADQHPWLAAVFSFVAPGTGQIYNGEWGKGIGVFLLAPLVVPWIWGVVDAARVAGTIRSGERDSGTVPTGMLLLAVKIVWVPVAIAYFLFAATVITALAALVGGLVGG